MDRNPTAERLRQSSSDLKSDHKSQELSGPSPEGFRRELLIVSLGVSNIDELVGQSLLLFAVSLFVSFRIPQERMRRVVVENGKTDFGDVMSSKRRHSLLK
mmetsp:Transcript_32044/g.43888  ORF Transcript_32044/g.43888 Transcript_32044/m.43888 type:complete len:101 (+) Transcript_32044:1087-1389(+)